MLNALKTRDKLYKTNFFSRVHLTFSLGRLVDKTSTSMLGARGSGQRKPREVLAVELSRVRVPSCQCAADMFEWLVDVSCQLPCSRKDSLRPSWLRH